MIVEKLREIAPQLLENEPMCTHTTFKAGGCADLYISVENEKQLSDILKVAVENDLPYIITGNGSNLLVTDKGIRGLVIEIGRNFAGCYADGDRIYAQAGTLLKRVAAVARENSLTGFEELSGIPGTVGGGIYMNAGAYGGEIKNVTESVTYIDSCGEIKTVSGDECEFNYRHSIFMDGDKAIISVVFRLKEGDKTEIDEKMSEYTKRRKEKQPLQYPSAGSTFKRPEGHFAGKLIEDAGLKGFSIGGAKVSELHAGFVINHDNGTAQDILDVIDYVKSVVYEKYKVMLEPEVQILGER